MQSFADISAINRENKARYSSIIVCITFAQYCKYMKSSASESVKNGYLNLERLSRSFRLAQPGISALERLWFRRRIFDVPSLMRKLL